MTGDMIEVDCEKGGGKAMAWDGAREMRTLTDTRSSSSDVERAASASEIVHQVDGREEDQRPGTAHSDTSDEDGTPSILDRVASRVTSRSSVDPGPPPDGGFHAWSQVAVGFFVISNSWGWINSFGVWQDYLPAVMPERSAFEISFIGSITVFLLFGLGAFTGRLADAGLFRHVFLFGSVMQMVGIFCTSLCTTYWQFMLAQGVCIGVGNGCVFCPALALISTYFHRKRGIALGIAACGSVLGGLIFPVMARQLLPRVGFPWTVRAIGFAQMAGAIVANVLSRPRIRPRRSGPIVDLGAFREMEYTFYAMASFSFFWGIYFAFFYLAAFSREELSDPFPFEDSLNLLLIVNGVGVAGRLVPNYIADRVGAVNVFIPVCGVASVLCFCWMAIETRGALYTWTTFYGLFAAGVQGLFPVGLSFLTTDLRKLGVRMGMVFTIVSFAVLTGPPIAGSIIDSTGSFVGAQAFSGTSLAMGVVFLTCSKIVRMRKTGMGWLDRV